MKIFGWLAALIGWVQCCYCERWNWKRAMPASYHIAPNEYICFECDYEIQMEQYDFDSELEDHVASYYPDPEDLLYEYEEDWYG